MLSSVSKAHNVFYSTVVGLLSESVVVSYEQTNEGYSKFVLVGYMNTDKSMTSTIVLDGEKIKSVESTYFVENNTTIKYEVTTNYNYSYRNHILPRYDLPNFVEV